MNDQCVARYNREKKIAERDCRSTNDFTCDIKNEKGCQICTENNCNMKKVSGANTLVASLTVVIIGVISTGAFRF